jgi:hypothetical protein
MLQYNLPGRRTCEVFPEPWYTIGDLDIGLEVLSEAIRYNFLANNCLTAIWFDTHANKYFYTQPGVYTDNVWYQHMGYYYYSEQLNGEVYWVPFEAEPTAYALRERRSLANPIHFDLHGPICRVIPSSDCVDPRGYCTNPAEPLPRGLRSDYCITFSIVQTRHEQTDLDYAHYNWYNIPVDSDYENEVYHGFPQPQFPLGPSHHVSPLDDALTLHHVYKVLEHAAVEHELLKTASRLMRDEIYHQRMTASPTSKQPSVTTLDGVNLRHMTYTPNYAPTSSSQLIKPKPAEPPSLAAIATAAMVHQSGFGDFDAGAALRAQYLRVPAVPPPHLSLKLPEPDVAQSPAYSPASLLPDSSPETSTPAAALPMPTLQRQHTLVPTSPSTPSTAAIHAPGTLRLIIDHPNC